MPRQNIPENLGVQKLMYAPGDGTSEPKSDHFERGLAELVDRPAATAVSQVARGNFYLSKADRHHLARFIAAQDMRNPYTRDFLLGRWQESIDAQMPAIIERFLMHVRVQGEVVTDAM